MDVQKNMQLTIISQRTKSNADNKGHVYNQNVVTRSYASRWLINSVRVLILNHYRTAFFLNSGLPKTHFSTVLLYDSASQVSFS